MHMCEIQAAKLEGKSYLFIADIPDLAYKSRNSKFWPSSKAFSLAFLSPHILDDSLSVTSHSRPRIFRTRMEKSIKIGIVNKIVEKHR